MSAKLQQVHVRVNDAGTGQPTPCVIAFTDPAGTVYVPYGQPQVLPDTPPPGSSIDGACEILLPPGPLHVSIRKGSEYAELTQTIQLPPGKLALRFDLQRVLQPAATGWTSGVLTRSPESPHELLRAGTAEGIQVVQLLAHERVASSATRLDYPNLVAFSGQQACLENAHGLVAVGTHNTHRTLGELALLHCHRIVYPLRFGRASDEPSPWQRPDNWTLADWCDQAHRKRGLVIATELELGAPTFGGETLANLILGKIDALACADERVWYRLLQLGLKLPRVTYAGAGPLAGAGLTYAQLAPGEPLSYPAWIEAVRRGKTSVSRGPLVTLTVNGQGSGAQVDVSGSDAPVLVRAEAEARARFARLELVHDGQVIHAVAAQPGDRTTAQLEVPVRIVHSGWLAARCVDRSSVTAHTSPIYVRFEQQPPPVDAALVQPLSDCLDRVAAWVRTEAACAAEQERARLLAVFAAANELLQRRLT